MKKFATIAFASTLMMQSFGPVFADSATSDVTTAETVVGTSSANSSLAVSNSANSSLVVPDSPNSSLVVPNSPNSSLVVPSSANSSLVGPTPESVAAAVSSSGSAADMIGDGLPAPLIYLSPDMSLYAAYIMPITGPATMLKGEARVADQTSDPTASETEERKVTAGATINATTGDGPIVIDNDLEQDEVITEYVWKEIPDNEGKMHIDAGGRFPVTVITSHTSKTAKVGDPVEARLKVDIKIGGRLIAPKGAKVMGHIASCERARKMIQAEFSMKRWMRPSGTLGVQFDEILTANGDHIPLVATPARQPRIVKNMAEGRVLGVNHKGEIVSPLSSQVKAQVAHMGIRAAASAAGPFSFGIVPVAYGVAGAISPSFAFMHPVGKNVRHRRLKGFSLGVVSGLPGGFLIADSIIRGDEAIIKPGDEFLAEFKQTFTGEASTEAQLSPNAKAKVHGQVMPETNGNTNPKK